MAESPDLRRAKLSFGALLVANAISLLGSAITIVALPLFVLSRSDSILEVALSGFASVLPVVLAGALGGTLIDRIGYRRVSIGSDLLVAVVLVTIPLLDAVGFLPLSLLLVLVVLRTLFDVPGMIARESLLPDLAAEARIGLDSANSLYETLPRVGLLVGPVLAAALVPLIGAANTLYLDAATFLFSAALIRLWVRGRQRRREASSEGYLAELREGFSLVAADSVLVALLSIVLVTNFVDEPFPVLILVIYAETVIGSAATVGILVAATAAGALLGTLLYGWLARRFVLSRRLVMIVAFAAVAATRLLLVPLPGLVGAATLLFVAGLASGPINPLLNTVIQERVPEDMRGRVFGFITAIAFAAAPLGVLVGGVALEQLGLAPTLAIVAGVWSVIALVVGNSDSIKSLGRTTPVEVRVNS
jgi:MFS family permease